VAVLRVEYVAHVIDVALGGLRGISRYAESGRGPAVMGDDAASSAGR